MSRMRALCASATALMIAGWLSAQITGDRPSPQEKLELLGTFLPMRDGVHLAADVYLPAATGRWPTILVRTPYSRKGPTSRSFRQFVPRGYALVLEDVRGRYASQGVFGEIRQEGPDGNDTVNWIAEQPWSNGKIAMAGSSYPGIVQWWAALEDNPHLRAIAPMCSGEDEYTDRFYSKGGAMKLGHRLSWLAANFTPPSQVRPLFSSYIDHLPLRTADVSAAGVQIPLWRRSLDHPSYDAYWKQRSVREQISRINVPVLSMGGWFDNYVESDLDMFAQLSSSHKEVETWIGPWGHNPGLGFPTRDFGREAILPIRATQASWFDRWLRKQDPAAPQSPNPQLHIFVMGPDIWREEREWPLARTRYTPLYLGSGGHANTKEGDGALRWQPVRKAQPDTFTYDPKDPVPTTGGAICCNPRLLPPGPLEQSSVEQRPDVLVYTSAPLNEDVEVTGPVRAVLYAATSANDTDFTAKLVDVQPDGRALAVCDGIQRLRYRLSLEKPVFVKRNTAYQISVDAGVTSYVFLSGHRMRLEISSSNFPRFDRNLNSSAPNADIAKIVKAKQTLYHEKSYPSAIILPIIPRHSS